MERRELLVVPPDFTPYRPGHAGSLFTVKRADDIVCVRRAPADSAAPVRRRATARTPCRIS